MRARALLGVTATVLLALALLGPALALAVDSSTTGSITLHKVQTGGADLAGADFSLYTDDGNNAFDSAVDTFVTNGTSDASGMLIFSSLPLASYWVVETNVPGGFVLADPVEVTLPDASGSTDVQLEVTNQIQSAATPHPTTLPATPANPLSGGANLPVVQLLVGSFLLISAGLAWLILSYKRATTER